LHTENEHLGARHGTYIKAREMEFLFYEKGQLIDKLEVCGEGAGSIALAKIANFKPQIP